MTALKSEFLCRLEAKLAPPLDGGNGLRIFAVLGGTFAGPRISGRVLAGGADWLRVRADGSGAMDVRITLQADDGAVIHVAYTGRLVIPPELMEQVLDLDTAQNVDPARYYFRSLPVFETASVAHDWLNHIVAVGVGQVGHGGVAYDIFAAR